MSWAIPNRFGFSAERAALVLSGFEVTKENAGAIIDICKRLDGIPLAIELAAARVDMFKVEEILNQLDRSFDLLVSSKRSGITAPSDPARLDRLGLEPADKL